jgi:hypothetical protein
MDACFFGAADAEGDPKIPLGFPKTLPQPAGAEES